MRKLIVVGTKVFIRLDGADIQTSSTYHGDVLEVKVPARMKATQNKKAFRLHEEGVYLLLSESWNAKDSWEIRDTTRGATLVWEYGDHHGMRGGALFIIESEQFQIDYDVPGHHGHTVEKYRLIGDTSGQYKIQERLDLSDIEELPAGKTKPAAKWMTAAEAEKRWGLPDGAVRKGCASGPIAGVCCGKGTCPQVRRNMASERYRHAGSVWR